MFGGDQSGGCETRCLGQGVLRAVEGGLRIAGVFGVEGGGRGQYRAASFSDRGVDQFCLGLRIERFGGPVPGAFGDLQVEEGVQGPARFRTQHTGTLGDGDRLVGVAAAGSRHVEAAQAQKLRLLRLQHLRVVALRAFLVAFELGCLGCKQKCQRRFADQRDRLVRLAAGFFVVACGNGDEAARDCGEAFAATSHRAPTEKFARGINEGRNDAIDRDRGDGERDDDHRSDRQAQTHFAIGQRDRHCAVHVGDQNCCERHKGDQKKQPQGADHCGRALMAWAIAVWGSTDRRWTPVRRARPRRAC
jgi:hypothetical protein